CRMEMHTHFNRCQQEPVSSYTAYLFCEIPNAYLNMQAIDGWMDGDGWWWFTGFLHFIKSQLTYNNRHMLEYMAHKKHLDSFIQDVTRWSDNHDKRIYPKLSLGDFKIAHKRDDWLAIYPAKICKGFIS
ncbi:hypothetical protein ACJX0J_017808, partial [Zea mays]